MIPDTVRIFHLQPLSKFHNQDSTKLNTTTDAENGRVPTSVQVNANSPNEKDVTCNEPLDVAQPTSRTTELATILRDHKHVYRFMFRIALRRKKRADSIRPNTDVMEEDLTEEDWVRDQSEDLRA